ncbi:MAG: Rho termination factor N-terminal domain-containing protein [Ignavibacteriales bacterium]
MQKALETVKKKEDRPREFTPRTNNRPYNREDNRPYNRDDNRPRYNSPRPVEEVKKIEKVEEPKKEVKVESAPKVEVKEDLTAKTVAELRELAKNKDIKGYSTMKKAELIEALK